MTQLGKIGGMDTSTRAKEFIEALDVTALRQRLTDLRAEERALAVLLRSAVARENARKREVHP